MSSQIQSPPNRYVDPTGEPQGMGFYLRSFFPWCFGFLSWWVATRRYRLLLGGIPALVFAVLVLLGVLSRPFYSADEKATRYKGAAQTAMEAKEYDQARVYFQKLYQLDAMDDPSEYQLALTAAEAGNLADAYERMSKLAPFEKPGYAPAHQWIAKVMMANALRLPRDEALAQAERHLTLWAMQEPNDLESRRLLALHYYGSGKFQEAANLLETLVAKQPEVGVSLAKVYQRLGNAGGAGQEAEKVIEHFRERENEGRSLTALQYFLWADAYGILDHLEQAEAVLLRGAQRHPEDFQLRELLAQVYFRQAHKLREDGTDRLPEQLEFLEKAMRVNPRDVAVLGRIAEITALEGDKAERAREILNPILAEGKAPALVHTILGSLAASQGNHELAAIHLEQACRLNPLGAVSLNNLAWVIAQSKDPDFERALQLVDQAVKIQPTSARFRETRGQILIKQERWSEAIAELEYALGELPDLANIHLSLATAYEQLGDKHLAEEHRQKAAEAAAKGTAE